MLMPINVNRGMMGFGCVIRDSNGKFVAAKGIPWIGVFQLKEAEAMSIREALSWLKKLNLEFVKVETDVLQVYNGILVESINFVLGFMLDDIKEMARGFSHLYFNFVKRSANRVAHLVAREAGSLPDCME